MQGTLEYALEYASRGWASFKLNLNKSPMKKCDSCSAGPRKFDPHGCFAQCGHRECHGFIGATTDRGLLTEWFSDGKYNLGLAVPPGHVVLDVDPRNGGDETLEQIRDLLPRETLVSRSGRGDGGKHLWFKGDLAPVTLAGIDVKRAGKGYVVAPPSVHPATGQPYTWFRFDKYADRIAQVPAELPSVFREGASEDNRTLNQILGISEGKRELFEAVIAGAEIPEGQQHDTLVVLAAYVASVYGEYHGRPLYDLIVSRCAVPHPEDDAERSWESAVAKYAEVPSIDNIDHRVDETTSGIDFSDELTGETTPERAYDRDVARLLYDMQVKEEARRQLRQNNSTWEPIEFAGLDDLLASPPDPDPYLIDGLWLEQGTVLYAAEAKAGKTTTMLNLVRSLADGVDFLGKFKVTPPKGNIVVLNVEVSPSMIARWYGDVSIEHPERVKIVNLRGRTGWFAILDERVRARVAEQIRAADGQVLIIDPVGPLWDAEGIDEKDNTPVGQWLTMLTELAKSAEISEVMVVHHFGHGAQRARGASKMIGWADSLWALIRDGDDSFKSDLEAEFSSVDDGAARYFMARGRDVDLGKTLLKYTPETRALEVDPEGIGGRNAKKHEAKKSEDLEVLRALISDNPKITQADARAELSWGSGRISKVWKLAHKGGEQSEPIDTESPETQSPSTT